LANANHALMEAQTGYLPRSVSPRFDNDRGDRPHSVQHHEGEGDPRTRERYGDSDHLDTGRRREAAEYPTNRGGRGVLANTPTAVRCVPPEEGVCDRRYDHGYRVEQHGIRAG